MYPKVIIDRKKLEHNTRVIGEQANKSRIDIFAVSKVYCGIPEIAQASLDGGAWGIADSRIENFEKMKNLDCPKILLRLPMISQVESVIRLVDISLNSEIETIKALNTEAKKQNKVHKIMLMVDLGDLREGILPADVDVTVEEILKLENIKLYGVGVNLTCYGGVIPNEDNLGELISIVNHIEKKFSIDIEMVSGGNSSSLYLLDEDRMPERINNLRYGEAIVLGRETKEGDRMPDTYDDVFKLEAEIVELKVKDSLPKGEIGMDAFGNRPSFEDKGKMKRAIIAIGRQDVNPDNLILDDADLEVIGASSDHMILDLTHAKKEYKVGDVISFKLEYGSLLSVFTSEYINKEIL